MKPNAEMKKTLCLDFDGVLHGYTGWSETPTGEPVPGALEFVKEAMRYFEVVIFSTRCNTEDGRLAIKRWLWKWDFPDLPLAKKKPPAFVTLDDRAMTFKGEWPSMQELTGFEAWWEKDLEHLLIR